MKNVSMNFLTFQRLKSEIVAFDGKRSLEVAHVGVAHQFFENRW